MSIHLTQPVAYADLGEVWLRDQSARLTQKHLQLGGNFPADVDALFARTARAVRAAQAPFSTELSTEDRIRRATIEAIEHCSRLEDHFSRAAAVAVAR